MVQIYRLENIEHTRMKQVSYGGKYSLSASRAHHSHTQFSFLVGDAFYQWFLSDIDLIEPQNIFFFSIFEKPNF